MSTPTTYICPDCTHGYHTDCRGASCCCSCRESDQDKPHPHPSPSIPITRPGARNLGPLTDEQALVIQALHETIAVLTARNQFLEQRASEAVTTLEALMAKPNPASATDPARTKLMRDAYINTQFDLAHRALSLIDTVLRVANQRPLDEIQARVVLKFLHTESMRGCATVAAANAKGLDHSFLLDMTGETIEEWLSENATGDSIGDIAQTTPPRQPFSNS